MATVPGDLFGGADAGVRRIAERAPLGFDAQVGAAEFGTVAARLLHDAQDAGFLTSIDVVSEDGDRFAEVVLPALKFTDYCLLNEFEAERTAGIPIRTAQGIDYAALQAINPGLVFVSLTGFGLTGARRDFCIRRRSR